MLLSHYTKATYNAYKPVTHHHVAVCGSTNSELMHSLVEDKLDSTQPYLLTASMQTAGRGQKTRTWQSPIGNIYLSLYHPLQSAISGLLSLVVGYHLTRLPIIQQINRQRQVQNLPTIGVKWANDIGYYDVDVSDNLESVKASRINCRLKNSSGLKKDHSLSKDNSSENSSFKKLAGILIEPVFINSKMVGVIVGVGVNIETAPLLSETTKEGMDYQAISLTQVIEETRSATDDQYQIKKRSSCLIFPKAEDLYRPVSSTILKAIAHFISFNEDPYSLDLFIKEYTAVNVLANRQVMVMQQQIDATIGINKNSYESQIIKGKVIGINTDGSLKLSTTCDQTVNTLNLYSGVIKLI